MNQPGTAYQSNRVLPAHHGTLLADAFWLERQWRSMPFSAALADAEEFRQQREGAGWYGGPRTETGMLVFGERQLRNMLQEQRAALRKVGLRRIALRLPGMVSCPK